MPTDATPDATPHVPLDARPGGIDVSALRDGIDAALLELVEGRSPTELYAPVQYVLEGGGKRVRPLLLLLTAHAYSGSTDPALPAALAVEVFHNFTLVHDDIMDASPKRRGRDTVHVQWDEETAILTGDFMMGMAYELLARLDDVDLRAVHAVYDPMVRELCRGQALDVAFQTRREVSVDAYIDMIDGKTVALFAASLEMGALVGGASTEAQKTLRKAGRNVGRAFQIQDDLLDIVADDDDWGKAVGGDLVNGKKTFVTLRALERATGAEHDWFARLHDGGLPPSDVPEARERMARLGVFDDAREAVARYTREADAALDVLPDGPATDGLHALLGKLQKRTH